MTDKKKAFISLPMNGKTNEEIKATISDITKDLNEKGYEVIDSFAKDFDTSNIPDHIKPIKFLAKSIEMLADADLVVFGKGWKNARGCKIEHDVAENYGKEIFDLEKILTDEQIIEGSVNGIKTKLISDTNAAAYLGVNESSIYRWRKEGKLNSVKIGGATFIALEEIEKLKKAMNKY